MLASTICSTLEKQLSPLLSCTRSSRRCRGQMIFQIVFSFFFHTFFSSCIKSRICDPHVIFGNHSKEWNAPPPLYQNCQCRNLCPDNKTNCPTFKKRICINQSIVTWLSNKIQARASKNWELCKYIFPSYFQSLVVC